MCKYSSYAKQIAQTYIWVCTFVSQKKGIQLIVSIARIVELKKNNSNLE